jgi:hypothetical protein
MTLKEDGALAVTGNNPLTLTPVHRPCDLSRSLFARYLQPRRDAVLHLRMMHTQFINLTDLCLHITGNNKDHTYALSPELVPERFGKPMEREFTH